MATPQVTPDSSHASIGEMAAAIASGLYLHRVGAVIILAPEPLALLCAVRRRWLGLIKSLQRERSSCLSAERILTLTGLLCRTQSVRFSLRREDVGISVVFVASGDPAGGRTPAFCVVKDARQRWQLQRLSVPHATKQKP